MHCHRCPHGPDVQAGKYRGVAFGKAPCSKCTLRKSSSAYTMEFDEKRAAAVEVAGEGPFPEEAPEETMPVSVTSARDRDKTQMSLKTAKPQGQEGQC